MSAPRDSDGSPGTAPNFWQTTASVAASFFGVQSSKNRERDFSRGKPGHFIAIGLLMTALFVAVVVMVVKHLLRAAGL